jgi:hypothetical protein
MSINKPVSGAVVTFDNFVILPSLPFADVDASKGKLLQNFGY